MRQAWFVLFFVVGSFGTSAYAQNVDQPVVPTGYESTDTFQVHEIPNAPGASTYISNDGARETPSAEPGPRSGFTFQVGQGLGFATAPRTRLDLGTHLTVGIGLGGFLNERTAILFRFLGAFSMQVAGDNATLTAAGIAHVQHWLAERWMLGAGVGIATMLTTFASETPVALVVEPRIGYAVGHWTHHSLVFALSFEANIRADFTLLAGFVSFEWHLH